MSGYVSLSIIIICITDNKNTVITYFVVMPEEDNKKVKILVVYQLLEHCVFSRNEAPFY
jgi:hypothetical protein